AEELPQTRARRGIGLGRGVVHPTLTTLPPAAAPRGAMPGELVPRARELVRTRTNPVRAPGPTPPRAPAPRRRQRRARLVPYAWRVHAAAGPPPTRRRAVRGTARPHGVQLPRRGLLAGSHGRGGRGTRTHRARDHRPRRAVRGRTLRRGGRRTGAGHRVRRRALAARRRAPASARPGRGGLPAALARDRPGAPARRGQGRAAVRGRRARRGRRRALVRPHRLSPGP